MKEWTFLKHLLLSIIIVILSLLSRLIIPVIILVINLFNVRQEAVIIGGVDGPTSIYITSTGIQNDLFIQQIILFIILLILYIPTKLLLKKILNKK